jgi:hypothetical protein
MIKGAGVCCWLPQSKEKDMKKLNVFKLLLILVFALGVNYLTATNDNPNDDLNGLLLFFPAMAVTKEDTPAGIATSLDLDLFSQTFKGGTLFMGVGQYSAVELAAVVDGMDNLGTELAANFDNWEELSDGDDALTVKSEVKKLTTRNRQRDGKRLSTISMKLVGITNDKKSFIESAHFNNVLRTFIILADGDENDFAVITGLNFSADWEGAGDGLWTLTLTALHGGPSETYISMYQNVDEIAS